MYNLFITEKAQKQVLKLSEEDAQHVKEDVSLYVVSRE
jgi:mRNA-degrading endonuclease RelE of RelBE toxin-antitoxin system